MDKIKWELEHHKALQKQIEVYKEYQESLLIKSWVYPGLCEFKIFTYEEQKFNVDRGFFTTAYLKYKGYGLADFSPEFKKNYKTGEFEIVGINFRPLPTFREIINLVRDITHEDRTVSDKIYEYTVEQEHITLQSAINGVGELKKYVYNEMKKLL